MMLGIIFLSIIMVATASVSFAEEKFHISGYGNAHYMDPSGMPALLDVELNADGSTKPEDNPNNATMQIRSFPSFSISPLQREYSLLLRWKRGTTPQHLPRIMPMWK